MNAVAMAEIGSWIAMNSKGFVLGRESQPSMVAKQYWAASQNRLQRWCSALKMFEQDLADEDAVHDPWPAIEVVVQEVLISELLTRVWSSAMVTHDAHNEGDELHGVAHGIHIGHIEAKNRAMRIMLKGQARNEKAFDRLNALRRRVERWTDLFLAQMPACNEADWFAFDKARVKDFRQENGEYDPGQLKTRQQIITASLTSDIANVCVPFPANPELNKAIVSGIIACFPSDRFDSLGLPKSTRMMWIENAHDDTQALMDELVGFEDRSDQTSIRTI